MTDTTFARDPGHIETAADTRARRRIAIGGIVQGVGFRPFVWSLATRLELGGYVANDSHGAIVEVEGDAHSIGQFLSTLSNEAPALAVIDSIAVAEISPLGQSRFEIAASNAAGEIQALVSPDVGTCADCIGELFDPANRRYRFPFINCTNCGPRFTIVRGVPYDRSRTTMTDFAMCADCAREYSDPLDRRFHAQPICCPACGPRLRLINRDGTTRPGDPIRDAAELLRSGRIVAVKGIGGYHLAVIASDERAVAQLRSLKHREEKPFAVMARDLAAARRLAEIDPREGDILEGSRRPVVLLRRRSEAPIADSVAPRNRLLGLMLPYTPLHHLLCSELNTPFVLTSGNVSDEPIAYRDDDAISRLSGIAAAFLIHDRPIHIRTDDSVVRTFRGRETPIRRSRGYAPQPLPLPWELRRPILACGAELKSTFCLAKGRRAFISHHIGDLENFETLRAFREAIEHFRSLFEITPEVVAFDLHPEYLSTKCALEREGVELIGVQHHHAHIASCLVDNGCQGPAIGVAFDGLGYGTDGTLWGGEFLIADLASFRRVGHFAPMPMPGASAAVREPWRMAMAYLNAAYGKAIPAELAVRQRNRDKWDKVAAITRAGVNAPMTSSVGRLFDAVASVLGVRDIAHYEGQAAIELEQRSDIEEAGAYSVPLRQSEPFECAGADLFHEVVEDFQSGSPVHVVAARFHNALARMIVDGCGVARARHSLSLVALSGGVFQNQLLLERTVTGLEKAGFSVLTHSRTPANDGGISLGQAAVAAARDLFRDVGNSKMIDSVI